MSLTTCPFCGQPTYGEIKPGVGTSYVITEVNETTKEFHATSGLPVQLFGCSSCKNIQLKCNSLRQEH